MGQERLCLKNGVQSRGPNRTRESRPSGIVERLGETCTRMERGTRCTTERVQIGNSPPTVARTTFLSRHPHATICGKDAEQPRPLPGGARELAPRREPQSRKEKTSNVKYKAGSAGSLGHDAI